MLELVLRLDDRHCLLVQLPCRSATHAAEHMDYGVVEPEVIEPDHLMPVLSEFIDPCDNLPRLVLPRTDFKLPLFPGVCVFSAQQETVGVFLCVINYLCHGILLSKKENTSVSMQHVKPTFRKLHLVG